MTGSIARLIHPATWQLLRFQSAGRWSRMFSSWRNPRRRWLAVLAIVLAAMWLFQAIAAVLFRESADPEQLKLWLPMGLATYSIWHVLKLLTRPAETPFDWTTAETEWLLTAPLTRSQLISYRLASIFQAAIAKAGCFTLLMLPDIPRWYLGMGGMLMGLLFVDLIRLTSELLFAGLSKRAKRLAQIGFLSIAATAFLSLTVISLNRPTAGADLSSPAALVFFQNLYAEFFDLANTQVGGWLLLPFRIFTTLALSDSITSQTALLAILGCGMSLAMLGSIYWLDRWCLRRRIDFDRNTIEQTRQRNGMHHRGRRQRTEEVTVRVPVRFGGAGSLMWRQLLGAIHYRSAVVFSLAVPVFLSCLPLFADHDRTSMLFHLVGSAVFYSFLLLPAALMLDYRRDLNRMAVLKALPIQPWLVTAGQLAVPVAICWMFQAVVLAIGWVGGRVDLAPSLLALFLTLPVTILIFSVENFIFLLSPYQRNREGLDVFLRTILTFTGKGVLFAIGLLMVLTWSLIAIAIVRSFGLAPQMATALFGVGIWAITLLSAGFFVQQTTRRFESFDPSADIPAK